MMILQSRSGDKRRSQVQYDASNSERAYDFAIPPDISTPLTLKTLPNALCRVRLEGSTEDAKELLTIADPQGLIRLHARPKGHFRVPIRFVVECNNGEERTQFLFSVMSEFEQNHAVSSFFPETLDVSFAGIPHPALTDDEKSHLTDSELVHRGYPMRPSAIAYPKLYESWLLTVSSPGRMIKPDCRAMPRKASPNLLTHSAQLTPNWSGFALPETRSYSTIPPTAATPYAWVHAVWWVPHATGANSLDCEYAFWVGLTDHAGSYLVQAGNVCTVVTFRTWALEIELSTYYPFTEVVPRQPVMAITNFHINPGDFISCDVWIGGTDGEVHIPGNTANFLIINHTSLGTWALVQTPLDGISANGELAVWIMERPYVPWSPSGVFGPWSSEQKYWGPAAFSSLANYGSALMAFCTARTADASPGEGYVPYYSASSYPVYMENVGRRLATATALDSLNIRFDWKAFQ
jgi:hypothetical protein